MVRNVGTACPGVLRIPLKVKGIDCATGCETTASINAQELSEAMAPIKDKILEVIKNVLHDLLPKTACEVMESRICLAGGGSLLPGMADLISKKQDTMYSSTTTLCTLL